MWQFLFIAISLLTSESAQLNPNIAYKGPFNSFSNKEPRRLLPDSSATENVKFYHGVASGDPTSEDLIIWTRVTPPFQDKFAIDRSDTYNLSEITQLKSIYQTISVKWAISTSIYSINFNCSDSNCGITQTSAEIDYTVKIIVDTLNSDTWYYYQFKVGNTKSDIGRTRTIPSPDSNVTSWKFAFGSCKQYAHGYFNNLGDIAEREDLDMMVWLGDYIYEFPNDPLVDGSDIDRIPFPNNFLYNLTHYRGRYLSHHLDENLQSAHKWLPWYMNWDDHEVVNDYWYNGAPDRWQDDSLYGVNFEQRKQNGYQAFFEWTPIRPINIDTNGGLHRSFRFGHLFDLILIDARSQRTKPADNTTLGASLSVDEHYAFGETQRNWFVDELVESQMNGIQWRIIGNDDVFGQSPPGNVFNGREFFGEDKLEGYDAERQIILDAIIDNDINNIVSLAGGPHTGIAQKVYSTGKPIKDNNESFPIFTEFVLDAISAPKLFEDSNYLPYIDNYADEWFWVSPHFRLLMDGYGVMDINKERVNVEYWINNNTRDPETNSYLDASFCVYDDVIEFDECSSYGIRISIDFLTFMIVFLFLFA